MAESGNATPPTTSTAGAILRAAREQQGIHIAVLAAAIKVSPRKLDALEGDRYDELPDATFTRALAQTVCRALKIDPQPVLALLPAATPAALETVGEGLNMPFRDRRAASSGLSSALPRAPLIWAALALLVAATLVVYWPARAPGTGSAQQTQPALPSVLPAASEAAGASAVAGEPPGAAVTPPIAADSVLAPAPPASAASQPAADGTSLPQGSPAVALPGSSGASITVTEPVWLEVIDGTGQVVFQRTIQPGESLAFEQTTPLKLKVGNVAGARLSFRGEPVDLTPFARSNVARIELK